MAATEELDAFNALAAVASEASELAGFHKGGAGVIIYLEEP